MTRSDMTAIMALEQRALPRGRVDPGDVRDGVRPARPHAAAATWSPRTADRASVGYAGMMFIRRTQADVLTIAVNPARWGEGTGSALLTALLGEAGERGCDEVLLEVRADNPRARQLYLRHGFAEIGDAARLLPAVRRGRDGDAEGAAR